MEEWIVKIWEGKLLGKKHRKFAHKNVAIVIVVLVAISMIAPSFMLLFSTKDNANAVYSLGNSSAGNSSIQGLQSQVDALSEAVKANPQDIPTRLNLANSYYDLATAIMGSSTLEQATPIFKQAVAEYQEVSKSQKDINILVDMATAAYYGGENDLADKTFKEALVIKPDFLNALLNYGFFLMNAKKDYMGAIAQWNTALTKANPSPEETERLKSFISMAQEQLQDSFEKSGTLNSDSTQSGAK
jgi:Tfp pilus assembly protein PilF